VCEERLKGTTQKGYFCARTALATPMEEGFAKQTQVMLLRGWSTEDVVQSNFKIDVKLEPWLRRYPGGKGASK
jgi:hypothetical protein